MALIACTDCGNQVSERAPSCPKCGAPMTASAAPVSVEKGVGVKEGVKIGVGMFIILPMILFFGGCVACVMLMSAAAGAR